VPILTPFYYRSEIDLVVYESNWPFLWFSLQRVLGWSS